uniref:cyclic nucleotide-gated cation channel beta-1 n=1 Tax=Oncorhynchus gorbuscha TaxID=8017 RepID=UPI001EAF4713|nr:cyclic nucleotide-gated cation channel beta-1 [Oncorhynchus gorbuscha]XP_046189886.1 cyclic nucleotide-gated cation channel beta-1 [Oncorhynchus gorbuscha]XP_046189888.1 cyclic nucleotide-gated cation channel beta-1 [Oncorhynchus gorbuscha]XP_046189889.1 cyclic nucleotide-gated cation channel beta-1 [Oncorhynchus gorbuscha]
MTKKQKQTTSFTPPQPRSLRSRKRKCSDESEESAPSGETVEAQPSHPEQQDTEGTVLNTTSPPKDLHCPLTACTTHPSQQANKAGDTTAPKQEGDPVEESPVVTGFEGEQVIGGAVEGAGTEESVPTNQDGGDSVESSVKDDEGREEEDIKTQSFLSFPPHPLTVAQPQPQPSLLPSKEVNVGDGDSQTDKEEEQCGEKNPKPNTEELDSEQQEAIDDRGVCLGGGREGPPVEEDRSVEEPVKKRRRRMGMCGLGERERRGIEEQWQKERKSVTEGGREGEEMVLVRKAEEEKVEKEREEDIGQSGDSGGGCANLVAVEGTTAASSSDPSLLSFNSPSAPLGRTTEQRKEEEKEEGEKLDEEQHADPSEVAYSGTEQVTGEGLRTGLEVDPLSEQPVVLVEEELDTEGVVEKNQEGDRGGCGSNEPEESPPRAPTPSSTTTPTSIPLEAGTEREHHGEVQSSPTQREGGAEDGAGTVALILSPADRGESTMPPTTKPGPGREGHNQAPVTPGGSEENNHSTTPDLTRDNDDAAVVDPFGVLPLDDVSDSQLNTITLTEKEEEEKEEGHEDATELVCGLIRELSYLNRVVMATHRELESLRRGNKTARPPPRRVFPPRRSEI